MYSSRVGDVEYKTLDEKDGRIEIYAYKKSKVILAVCIHDPTPKWIHIQLDKDQAIKLCRLALTACERIEEG